MLNVFQRQTGVKANERLPEITRGQLSYVYYYRSRQCRLNRLFNLDVDTVYQKSQTVAKSFHYSHTILNNGAYGVNDQDKPKFQFSTAGILLGVIFVVVSIVWFAIAVISDKDSSGEDITWVG